MKNERKNTNTAVKVFLAAIFLINLACGTTQNPAEAEQEYEELVQLVESRKFEITNDWAYPLQGNNINLIGNHNFIRAKGDSVEVYLPYFGVRHSGGGYGTSGGIEFKGQAKNLAVEENPEQREIYLRFEGNQDNENLEFIITLFPNGKVNTSVNSSQRSNISYTGEINQTED